MDKQTVMVIFRHTEVPMMAAFQADLLLLYVPKMAAFQAAAAQYALYIFQRWLLYKQTVLVMSRHGQANSVGDFQAWIFQR